MQGVVQHRACLRGRWGFRVTPDADYAALYLLTRGNVWASTASTRSVRVGPGTMILARPGQLHVVSSHREAVALDARRFLARCDADGPLRIRYGSGVRIAELVMGFVRLREHRANPLVASMPPLVVMEGSEAASSSEAMETMLAIDRELVAARPGVEAIAGRLAEVLFLRIVREWIEDPALGGGQPSLVAGLHDASLTPALSAIHENPTRAWTVGSLARHVGMSRTAFATRFAAAVGLGPVAYLRRVRMHRACEHLREGDLDLAEVARRVGYASQAAFTRQFKRELGLTPSAYRRAQ